MITWKYTEKEASISERKIKLLPESPTTLNKKKSSLNVYAWIYVAESCLNSSVYLSLDLLKLKCYWKENVFFIQLPAVLRDDENI